MPGLVVIGEGAEVEGFLLAGARVVAAEGGAQVRAALAGPAADAAVVILTPRAFEAAGFGPAGPRVAPGAPLVVVMPP